MKQCEYCKYWYNNQCKKFPVLYPVYREATNWCWCRKFLRGQSEKD